MRFKPGGGCCRCAKQSRLLTGVIVLLCRRLSRSVLLAVLSRAVVCREIPGSGRGADRAADVHAVCLSVRIVAAEQPGHQLHQPVPQPRNRVSAHAAGSDPDDFPLEIHRIHVAGVVGVFIPDRAAAGGVWPGARRAVAFLRDDAGVDRVVHRAAGCAGRVAGDFDGAVSGSAQFSNCGRGNGHRSRSRWSRFGGRRSRPPTTCSANARSRRSISCSPGRVSRCFRSCPVTGCRRPCCNGRKASCAARRFSRWCC